jgi:hypothetical protein
VKSDPSNVDGTAVSVVQGTRTYVSRVKEKKASPHIDLGRKRLLAGSCDMHECQWALCATVDCISQGQTEPRNVQWHPSWNSYRLPFIRMGMNTYLHTVV